MAWHENTILHVYLYHLFTYHYVPKEMGKSIQIIKFSFSFRDVNRDKYLNKNSCKDKSGENNN